MRSRRISNFSLRAVVGAVIVGFAVVAGLPAASAAEDEAAWLFDPEAVVYIDLDLPQASIEALVKEPLEEYQPATFSLTVGGQTYGPMSVGARLKGGLGSFRPLSGKAAFKIKFDELVDDQKFFGLEKLTLNNMVQDSSMMHETFAYEAFRSVGVAAPRTGYAFVQVNGEDYGLYLSVETLDSVALPRWFGSTLHLYEGAYGTDVTRGGADAFEVDEGKSKKREDLEMLIVAANEPEGDWSEGMAGFTDLDQMARMWAVERYVGHWDGYSGVPGTLRPNNYYLHSDEAGEFQMLPWGTDQTWEDHLGFGEEAGGLLFNECLADASCEALYDDALADLYSKVAGLELDRHAAELAELLAPCQALETEPRREFTAEEIQEGVEGTREFVVDRPVQLREWLGLPPEGPFAEESPGSLDDELCLSSQPGSDTGQQFGAGAAAPPVLLGQIEPQTVWIGPSKLRGMNIVTRMNVPVPGLAEKVVTARLGKRRQVVCTANRNRELAGSLELRCRLPEWAMQRRENGPLKLKVSASFTPSGGQPEFETSPLTAPRLAKNG